MSLHSTAPSPPASIVIPDFAFVMLVGSDPALTRKFSARHFASSELLGPECATSWDGLADRLEHRKLTVIDVSNLSQERLKDLIALATTYHTPRVAIILPDAVPHHPFSTKRVQSVFTLKTMDTEIQRQPLPCDHRGDHGPFDIIGDLHGCFDETKILLQRLGYVFEPFDRESEGPILATHPEGRRAFFVGDLTDRGPKNVDCLRLVMGMVEHGSAKCVVGNHDAKLARWLSGKNVTLRYGLEVTVAELNAASQGFRQQVSAFIESLPSHQWLAEGRLAIAHAGLKESMHGRRGGAVRSFAMYGDTTGKVDEAGRPVRLDWAQDYHGKAVVVYGHTPMIDAQWVNNTICIDTGCVFGGRLTALRWPECEVVSVQALDKYAQPSRPLGTR